MDATTETPKPSEGGRVIELDALRGLAALAVLGYHYTSVYPRLIARQAFAHVPELDFGYFGVELFFMISGFVIFFSAGRSRSVRDFALSRFSRLYPVYWAAVGLTTAIELAVYHPSARAILVKSLANLTMLQSFAGVDNMDPSYWTLALELSFYGLIVVAMRLTTARGLRIEWALLTWLAAVTVIRGLSLHLPYRLTILGLQNYGQFFVFGTVLFLETTGKASRLTYACGVWALLMCAFGADPRTPANGFTHYFAYCVACASLMICALRFKPRILSSRTLQFFGRISYSLYLVHSTIGFLVIAIVMTTMGSDIAAVTLATLASVLAAWLLNISVETPGRLFLARRFGLHRPSIPA